MRRSRKNVFAQRRQHAISDMHAYAQHDYKSITKSTIATICWANVDVTLFQWAHSLFAYEFYFNFRKVIT